MKSIKSNLTDKLICTYITKQEISQYRTDLSTDSEILQCSARILKEGLYIAPHKHLPIERNTIGTQESWVILEGKLLASVYDEDASLLAEIELGAGSCIVFFGGGHSLKVLNDNTIFFEFKNGPYYGYDNDKHDI